MGEYANEIKKIDEEYADKLNAYNVLSNNEKRLQHDIELYKKLSDYNKAKMLENKTKMLLMKKIFSSWKKKKEEEYDNDKPAEGEEDEDGSSFNNEDMEKIEKMA